MNDLVDYEELVIVTFNIRWIDLSEGSTRLLCALL